MSLPYFKNHLGFSLTEAEFQDIPHPTLELTLHVTMKTVQAGALLGTVILGPLAAVARSSTRNWAGIVQKSRRFGLNGMLIGLGLGPVITYLRIRNFSEGEIYDRDYRLRFNRGQVRVDRAALLGGVAGAGLNVARGGCPIFGGLVGISSGILGMAAYNASQAKE